MKTILRSQTKFPFLNPYVIRLDHSGNTTWSMEFYSLKIKIYQLLKNVSTWGFCYPASEEITDIDDELNYYFITRSYWCFKDKIDALNFILMTKEKAIHVQMWPTREFTVFKVVETE